jgi:hypothetical protein
LHGRQRTGTSCFIRVAVRETGDVSTDNEWYWDLNRKVAGPAAERGAFDHLLGPYGSKHDAENWKSIAEERNDEWTEDDEEWNRADDD